MPAQMKTKSGTSCLREGNVLQPRRQSIKISKSSNFDVKLSQQATLDSSIHTDEDVSVLDTGSAVCVDYEDIYPAATFQFQKQLPSIGSSVVGRSESLPSTAPTILETIFSPILEFDEVHCKSIHNSAGTNDKHTDVATDGSDDGTSSSSDYQTCNASDSMISDMGASSLSFDHNVELDDILTGSWSPDYEYGGLDMLFDMEERYTILPFLEDSIETSNTQDGESVEEAVVNSVDAGLYLAIQQIKPSEQKTDLGCYFGDLDELDSFDPHLFIRNLPELSETYPSVWPMLVPKETRMRKPVTLVLDLDETLVHSTLDFCEDADFTFPVFFNLKEQIVYVRQRPHLHLFLERVAKMFEVVIFTASLSIYAEQLLNILDPDHRLITHRVYRESCIFSDGSYTKDLTILGLDLAKVAIVDNSPQVFQLQVNNGIPILSWFDDQSDSALISLLPFLETLANVEDVRPIIAKRFNNKELLLPHGH